MYFPPPLSKEIEEKLRSQLSHMTIPMRYHDKKKKMEKVEENDEDKPSHQHPSYSKEEEERLVLKNFTEYLDKIRDDKKKEIIHKKTSMEQMEDEIDHPMFDSDSPLTMGSSISENDDLDEDVYPMKHISTTTHRTYRKLTYKEVERSLDFYEDDENKYLNELDILITFLKGQTQLYALSQYLTQQKIHFLSIPSFMFSVTVTVMAPLIHQYVWSGILISALTASIAALFGCVQFYGLDAACAAYLYLTNQYNKMQLSLETLSNSLVIGTGNMKGVMEIKDVMDKIRDVEHRITELKDSNFVLPPEEVKLLIPIISHVNIFSFIKKIRTMKKNKISKYREVKNEIRFILNHWEQSQPAMLSRTNHDDVSEHFILYEPIEASRSSSHEDSQLPPVIQAQKEQKEWKKKQHQMIREKNRMNFLLKRKAEIRKELNDCRTAYSYMDELFTREIYYADHTNHWWMILRWWLGFKSNDLPKNNPVVDKYLEFIFIHPSSPSSQQPLEDYKNTLDMV